MLFAQTNPPGSTPVSQPGTTAPPSRVLGILPNYRSGEESDPFSPLSARRKFYIGYKDSTDYPIFFIAAGLAGLAQMTAEHSEFGGGVKSYSQRLGAAVADQVIANMLTESVMPSLLREDPRYFRRGHGGFLSRTGYAASRVFVARNDHGKWTFNAAEVSGNAIGSIIGNAYYPGERRLGDNFERFYSQMATDAFSQVLKEFWPDIWRKYLHHEPKP
ncbi:MAG: hypothetical protein ACRD4E_16135 [Bryobacteraceae bacterium]